MDPRLDGGSLRAWERLAAEAGSLPTQDAAWTIASLACFPGEPRILDLGDPPELRAIAPLVRHGSTLELAGGRELGEPVDLLAASPDALAELADELARRGRPIVLERVPARSPTIAALRAAFGGRARIRLEEAVSSPMLELGESWAEPGGGLSSSRRSALRRSRRKAEKHGEVEVELRSPKPDEVEALLDEAFAVESRSWKGEEGTAVVFVPKMNAFYRRYAAELAQRGQLRLEFLRIGGRTVAMQFAAGWSNRHWLFKIGYDAAYAAGSPGQLLLAASIADAARAGLASYEFLGSREAWTDVWTEQVEPCVRVTVLPRSPRSAVAVGSIRRRAATERVGGILRRRKRMLAKVAKGRYVSGPELSDALREEGRYSRAGYATTVGFWNGTADTPEDVAREASASAEALPAGSEVSLKLVAIGGDGPVLDELAALCARRELTLHLDALGPDSAAAAQATAKRLDASAPGKVGCTLPGRWARSAEDARALQGSGMRVRVTKGEVEDADGADLDPSAGFLDLIDALAGGSCHVEVATQDPALAETALERLKAAGTSCELQVLHAMRSSAAVEVARKLGIGVRVYVPYGTGRMPYTREAIESRPALALVFARDLLPIGPRRPPGA